jgi:hypothetical protein
MKLNSTKSKRLLYLFAKSVQLLLGLLYLWSSASKIRQPYDFLGSVYNYELVGPKLGILIAITIPWLELLIGICLIGGIFIGGSLLVSIGLGIMFTVVLSSALYRDLEITCGCFGTTEIIGYPTLIRALMILLVSLLAYIVLVIQRPYSKFTRMDPTAI